MASDMLRRQGYTVLIADDGAEALEIWDRQRESIRLLVTDVVMPRVNGRELAERLREARPDLPVLYVSGYSDEVIARHGILNPDAGFLPKPFTQAELGRKVRTLLDVAAGR